MNLTRSAMREAGFSPSVRLFEAAACGTPIISDEWEGLETILQPGKEILTFKSSRDVVGYLRDFSEKERQAVGARARSRVLRQHTAECRAKELETLLSGRQSTQIFELQEINS